MALKKPIANYSGEFNTIESGDAIDPTVGGTGFTSFTTGYYLRALSTTALEQRSPAQVLSDIGALAAASYTAADVLSKLLTVDGASSGLDSDLLDGQEGTYYRNAGNLNAGTLLDARVAASNVTQHQASLSIAWSQITGDTTVGSNLVTLTNPSAISFLRVNADNTVSALTASAFRTAIGAGTGDGTVTSVGLTLPTGLSVAGSPVTTTGTLAVTFTAGYSIPTTAKQTEWDTAYTNNLRWDGGATGLVAATGRTSLGLGTAAQSNTGTSGATVPLLNTNVTWSGTSTFSNTVTVSASAFVVSGNRTGATTLNSISVSPVIQSDVTSSFSGFVTNFDTQASVFTLTNLYGFLAQDFTPGAGSVVTNNFGFRTGNLTAGTNNYGFYSSVTSTSSGQWNFYSQGAAPNYFAGEVRIGNASDLGAYALQVTGGSLFVNAPTFTDASGTRTNLGATTVGSNLFTLTNPSAVRFLRVNADNTVDTLDASTFRTAIGAGTSSTVGTVTSVAAGNGLTFTTITASGSVTLGTPSSITPTTTNGVTTNSHTHDITLVAATSLIGDAASVYPDSLVTAGQTSDTIRTVLTVKADTGENRVFQFLAGVNGGSQIPTLGYRTSHTSGGGGGWTSIYDILHSGNFIAGTDYATPAAVTALVANYLPLAGGTMSGNILFSGTNWTITADTADASDTKRFSAGGGGAITNSRGAYIYLNGNEHASTPGIARIAAGAGSNIELITTGAGKVVLSGGGSNNVLWVQSSGSGLTAVGQTDSGIELTALGMNTTAKYTPGIKFGSTDPELTTTNPKFGAMIVGYSTETYNLDTSGGMGMEFFTTDNAPGTAGALSSTMKLTPAMLEMTDPLATIVARYFAGPATVAILATTSAAGTVYLRPNGIGDTTGQLIVNTSTATYAGNTIYHAGNFVSGTDYTDIITLTAGNGLTGGGTTAANRTFTLGTPTTLTASTTNAVTSTSHTHAITGFASLAAANTFDAASITIDNTTTNTDLYLHSTGVLGGGVTANISGGVSYLILHTTSGIVYLRPNGRGTTTGQAFVNTTGDFQAAGAIKANQDFASTATNTVLSNNGAAGTIYLRPNGVASSSGQATLSSAGLLTVPSLALTTALAITEGGTGATSASAARGNLGLALGVDVQIHSAALQSIAGLTTVANRGIYTTAADTYAVYTLTAGGRALAGMTGTINTFPYFSAANVVSNATITAAGLALLDDASASAQLTTLGAMPLAGGAFTGAVTSNNSISDVAGNLRDIPQNIQNANYTVALTDRGKHLLSNNTTAYAWTIPPNSTTAFPIGSIITFVHSAASGTKTVTAGAGVTFNWIDGTTGNVALTATKRACTAMKIATDTWLIS